MAKYNVWYDIRVCIPVEATDTIDAQCKAGSIVSKGTLNKFQDTGMEKNSINFQWIDEVEDGDL